MWKSCIAIAFIWVCTSTAWVGLAATLDWRTEERDASARDGVTALWGRPHVQRAPVLVTEGDGGRERGLGASDVDVTIDLEHRSKGLLWFSTYRVAFDGSWRVTNPQDEPLSGGQRV